MGAQSAAPASDVILTVGHSTRSVEEFTGLLLAHAVETLVDVRSYPGSRRCPWFGHDEMARWLPEASITYAHLPALGGRRNKQPGVDPDLNGAWRNPSFRNYADYAIGAEFADGLAELERLARESRVAFCCSEAWYIRCHRRIIADHLTARQWQVEHIVDDHPARAHKMTDEAVVTSGIVSYPSPQLALATS